MKPTYLLLTLLFVAGTALAQKRPIPLDSLDHWESFTERRFSPDGRWLLYATSPRQPQRPLLRLQQLPGNSPRYFPNAGGGRFSNDSRACSFTIAGTPDTLVIIDLTSGAEQRVPGAGAFAWADSNSRVRAWIRKDSAQLWVDTGSGAAPIAGKGVGAFWLRPDGSALLHSVRDSSGNSLLYTNLATGRRDTLVRGAAALGSPAFRKGWQQLAFAAQRGGTQVLLYTPGSFAPQALPLPHPATDSGYVLRPDSRLQLLDDGRLLYTTAYADPVRRQQLPTGSPQVELWSTTDALLYPQQKKELGKRLSTSCTFLFDATTGGSILVKGIDDDEYFLPVSGAPRLALVTQSGPYRRQTQWDPVPRRDAFLVDLASGARDLVARNTAASFSLSPAGRYVAWFDQDRSQHFAYDIAAHRTRRIDAGVTDDVADRSLGMPVLPEAYGTVLWEAGDSSLLLATNRDVWQVDPAGRKKAINLTGGTARREGMRLQFYPHRARHYFQNGDTLLFYVTADRSKHAGFWSVVPGPPAPPKRLLFGPYSFSFPGMAPATGSSRIVLSFGNSSGYGLFTSTDLVRFDTVYLLNPERGRYEGYRGSLQRWHLPDGNMAEGALYLPESFDPKKRYPLIVWLYENGHAANAHAYVHPAQSASIVNFAFYASHGYAVFVPDVRYRTGAPGESAWDAVRTGLRQIIGQGWVDTARLGIQSHSWGAYQAVYILTRTNMFRAAAAGAVVSNMTSAYGGIRANQGESRQWIYERHQSRIGVSLWEDLPRYIRNSPLFAADRIRTPLLLVHNESDGGVPFAQGVEFFSALKRLGKKAWLLNYPGEDHVLANPINQRDFTRRLFYFFEHYLKGAPAPAWMTEGIPAAHEGYRLGY